MIKNLFGIIALLLLAFAVAVNVKEEDVNLQSVEDE
jgi:hypothetical protein